MKVTERMNANHLVMSDGEKEIFQSYQSVIAIRHGRLLSSKVSLSNHWDYSRTTVKHLVKFLCLDNAKELRANVKAGLYLMNIDTNGVEA